MWFLINKVSFHADKNTENLGMLFLGYVRFGGKIKNMGREIKLFVHIKEKEKKMKSWEIGLFTENEHVFKLW